ncbi:MAG: YebC/PmpR family DNA-binding transcriptional regulator, partial [Terrimicrobiaceae bacterium]|nr:YebC/PmpR family DNA-binding transcriptional regulator [Terrimicrobiaceae bacterium]
MAGHSKWSKVKRIKGALDAKRGMLFSKLSKEISVAARAGGGNPDANPRLRAAIQSARAQSMPGENIERAIKKGTGESGAAALEEMVYEGYAPGGVAVIIEAATDNKNRTAAELRSIFSKNGGSLAGPGSVAYLFQRKGQITLPLDAANEDQLLDLAASAGADELESDEAHHVILTPPDRLAAVADALRAAGLTPESQRLTYVSASSVRVAEPSQARQALRLLEALEESDDVLHVHANLEVGDD